LVSENPHKENAFGQEAGDRGKLWKVVKKGRRGGEKVSVSLGATVETTRVVARMEAQLSQGKRRGGKKKGSFWGSGLARNIFFLTQNVAR